MKILLQLLLFNLLVSPLFSQDLSKEQVKESLVSLRDDIQSYNPALADYNPNFEQQATQIIDGIDQSSYSPIEHFKLITEMCVISNEGHFALGSWSDTPHAGFRANIYKYLPLTVEIIEGKIYIWNDYSNEDQLKRGDEIRSINGQSASEIIGQLMNYTESDGDIVGYAHLLIESGFNWRYYLYIDTPETFEITYSRLASGEEGKVSIQAITNKELLANYKAKYPSREKSEESIADVYELNIENDYAVLKLKSFTRSKLEKYKLKSVKFYQEIFQKIADSRASTLIVDLRDNSGGIKDFANDMVPFIMKEERPDPFLRRSISWAGKEKILKLPKKNKLVFQGKVIALVNEGTYSAASSLARFLKEYANAVVVGQETATRYEGFSAGSKQYVNVLHSDIQIGIPRYQTIYPVSKKQTTSNRGLLPDHTISYTIEDIIKDKDLEMEFVKSNLIKE